jgi:methionine sulfoxide reductase heme-binding subunit
MSITLLDLVAYLGLGAVGAFTLNLFLGVLMAFRYSPVRYWPYRHFNYFALHKFSGYSALALAVAHILLLAFNKDPRFRIIDLFYPVHSPKQPLENTIGALAFYVLVIVVGTSYFRIQVGRRVWKAFHFSVYIAAIALFWHALLTDPDLKGAPIDWLDGGKVFVELSAVFVVLASLVRWRHARRKAASQRSAVAVVASSSQS